LPAEDQARAPRIARILSPVIAVAVTLSLAAGALASGGSLGFLETDQDGVGGVSGLDNPDATAVSPDGKNVYVGSCGSASVAVFSRNATTGVLDFVEAKRNGSGGVTGMLCPTDVAVSRDGKSVYVTASDSDAVAVFARSTASGALSFVESETGGAPSVPYGLAVSPDGKNVYVAEYGGGVIAYARDPTTGALSFVDEHEGPALDGAQYLDVSPDGKNVYVPASGGKALSVFSRDATTGALTLVEVEQQGVGGVDGLNGGDAAAVSRDGDDVYVTALYQGTVATFARSSSTGALTFHGAQDSHVSACDLAISPDDANVYVAGCDFQAMATFSRNTSGALSPVSVVKHGDRAVDVREYWSPSVSPDGKNVYVADLTGDAVATFARNPPPFQVTLRGRARQSVDALKVTAECSLGCGLFATAHVKVGHAKFISRKVKADLSGLDKTRLDLEFRASTLRAIRKQLKKHSGKAKIRANAAAGEEKDTAEVAVAVRR
jgi:DNA-binding beta-propeller fold protein YncE